MFSYVTLLVLQGRFCFWRWFSIIIYYAGTTGHVTAVNTAVANGCKHLMLSYYYKDSSKAIRRFRRLGLHLFLDSGAFSAWKKGIDISLTDYIDYIRANHIGKYVALDVIGDPEATRFNLKRMEREGLYPVPVFHLGSDIRYLRQLHDDGYRYICLGGTVGAGRNVRKRFFDLCFSEFPDLYFHGLGMTDPHLMLTYPWYSVDSTTWLVGRKYGRLINREGKRMYLPNEISTQDKIAINVRLLNEFEQETEGCG